MSKFLGQMNSISDKNNFLNFSGVLTCMNITTILVLMPHKEKSLLKVDVIYVSIIGADSKLNLLNRFCLSVSSYDSESGISGPTNEIYLYLVEFSYTYFPLEAK